MDGTGSVLTQDIIRTGIRVDQSIQQLRELCCQRLGVCTETIDYCVSTGYGRNRVDYRDEQVTEITCHARGMHEVFPEARTIIDIGGQDSKVINLHADGSIQKFIMNDQCAAGTGRFIEVMARIVDIPLEEVGPLSLKATEPATISSVCTVFAESEVISKAAGGVSPENILAGIHQSVARRINGLLGAAWQPPLAMSGGLAQNPGLVAELEKMAGRKIFVPEEPQFIGALGAAYIALQRMNET